MRILGYALMLFGVGVAAVLLFTGNAGFFRGLRVVLLASTVVAFGYRLTMPGPKLSATPSVTEASRDAIAEGTVELPMTEEVKAILAHSAAKIHRSAFNALIGIVAAGQVLALGVYYFDLPQDPLKYYVATAVSILIAVPIVIITLIMAARMRRDGKNLTYSRTTGPIKLVPVQNSYTLRMVGRSFGIEPKRVAPALKGLDWASIDYSPLGHVVLLVRNRGGETLYRANGSLPGPEAAAKSV